MRSLCISVLLICVGLPASAQQAMEGPTDEKAQKTYNHALESLKKHEHESALDGFKKADKQDSGHCLDCQKQMIKLGTELGDWKAAELAGEELVAEAKDERSVALAHYQFALLLMTEGSRKRKEEFFSRAHEEVTKALAAAANFPDAILLDGRALAQLRQDDAAKARFEQFVKMKSAEDPNRQRAMRYIKRPELARSRMAPPFTIVTTDRERISMDELQGKVVLLDFWATWCAPCREALPHIRKMAKKFEGQPLVILSISLDTDEQKWKEFIDKNEMTWPQYRDDGFTGRLAKMFGVTAIPHTFTIDADGVLQEEHIGDASVEGKLKKLLAQARDVQSTETTR